MAISENNLTQVQLINQETIQQTGVRRTALFGLISWIEVVKTDILGKELRIECLSSADKVFINGKEFIEKIT